MKRSGFLKAMPFAASALTPVAKAAVVDEFNKDRFTVRVLDYETKELVSNARIYIAIGAQHDVLVNDVTDEDGLLEIVVPKDLDMRAECLMRVRCVTDDIWYSSYENNHTNISELIHSDGSAFEVNMQQDRFY